MMRLFPQNVWFLGVVCVLFFSPKTQGQSKFDRYSLNNGLIHTHVLSVIQDSEKMMWVGTHAGLHQFDGHSFRHFRSSLEDSTSLSNNAVNVIYESSTGALWVGTEGGLNLFDRDTKQFVRFVHESSDENSLSHNSIKTIYEDTEGKIWVGTYGGGLNSLDPKTYDIQRFDSEVLNIADRSFDRINTLMAINPNEFWIGTEKGGLFVFDRQSQKIQKQYRSLVPSSNKSSLITDIKRHKSGDIYIATWNEGLFQTDSLAKTFKPTIYFNTKKDNPRLQNIRTIAEDAQGHLWLAHFGSGLTRLDVQSGVYSRYVYDKNDSKSLSNDYAWALAIDHAENIWVGTFGGGLCKMPLRSYIIPLKVVNDRSDGHNHIVKAVFQSARGEVLLGTLSSGLFEYKLSNNEFDQITLPNEGISRSIITISEDSRERLWVGTDFGLFKIDSTRTKTTRYTNDPGNPGSIEDAPIFSLTFDKNNNLWIGTWNGGLQMLTAQEADLEDPSLATFVKYRHDDDDSTSISNNIINALFCDSKNQLWVGTSMYLERMDIQTGKFTQVKRIITNSILQGHHSDLWIATPAEGLWQLDLQGNVLKHFDGSEHDPFSIASNLPNPITLGMVRHADSSIWITTNGGLSIFNPKTTTFSHYSLGELNQSALSLNSIETLRSGEVLIGGIDGFNIIHPDSLQTSDPPQSVFITDVKIAGTSLYYDRNIKVRDKLQSKQGEVPTLMLNQQDRGLSISFSVLEYDAPEKIDFAYKLDGLEKGWNYTSTNFRHAQYSSLPSGNYRLLLKATNNRGVWGNPELGLHVIVTPPFWATWPFRILMGLLTLGCVFLIIRLRTRQLYYQKERLLELVDQKTSELSLKSEQLLDQNKSLKEQKEEIIRITEAVRKANENKIRFFTSVSHEFRTPLTLILGPIEQLKEKMTSSLNPENLHLLSIIEKNGFRLLRLVNEILDFRKIDTDNMKIICVKSDIVLFLDQLVQGFEETARRKKITLTFSKSPQDFICWFDPGKLEIICYNLLANALSFTQEGGQVDFTVHLNDDAQVVQIEVKDNGPGIQAKDLESVFKRFYQIDDSDHHSKGSGIGLSLTKEMVEVQGGDITVESKPFEETVFKVSVPLFDPENFQDDRNIIFNEYGRPQHDLSLSGQFVRDPLNYKKAEAVSKSKKKQIILIVEDNLDMQGYLLSCLESTYQVILATNGADGLKLAKSSQPDIIISDIMMPEMNGLELCQKVKSDLVISHIPVILLSAQTSYETQLEGYDLGADAFIAKPFSQRLLHARLRSILAAKKRLYSLFKNQAILEPAKITVTSVDEEFVRKSKELVEQNIGNSSFEVKDLMRELGVSRTLLHTKFKKLMNCSTTEFIKTMRMNRACQLLKSSDHRVSDICYMVGYSDPHNFSKVFKQHFGRTPTEYKGSH